MSKYAAKVICAPDLFEGWARSYSLGGPFEYAGRLWKCTGLAYGPLDAWGCSPAPLLYAGEVVTQEIWPEAPITCGAPGLRGRLTRIGHATKGHPYVYTGRSLLASLNCGSETYWSEPGRRSCKADRPDNWPCLQL